MNLKLEVEEALEAAASKLDFWKIEMYEDVNDLKNPLHDMCFSCNYDATLEKQDDAIAICDCNETANERRIAHCENQFVEDWKHLGEAVSSAASAENTLITSKAISAEDKQQISSAITTLAIAMVSAPTDLVSSDVVPPFSKLLHCGKDLGIAKLLMGLYLAFTQDDRLRRRAVPRGPETKYIICKSPRGTTPGEGE